MEHTKLPWKHNGNSNGIHTQEGHCIATTHNGDMKWNDAAFIHLACSNHQKLVDALEKIVNSPTPFNQRELESWRETAIQIAQETLNKLKG